MEKSQLINQIVDMQQRAFRVLGQNSASGWVDSGLTMVQLRSLLLIVAKGSTNFRKLAETMGVTPSTVTGIVDRLVEQGLVSRTENPADRRETILEATDRGQNLLENIRENAVNHMTEVLTLLSLEELSALAQGLSAFVRAASANEGKPDK